MLLITTEEKHPDDFTPRNAKNIGTMQNQNRAPEKAQTTSRSGCH